MSSNRLLPSSTNPRSEHDTENPRTPAPGGFRIPPTILYIPLDSVYTAMYSSHMSNHTSIVPPTVKDISRAVAQLNDRQDEESLERVARNMAFTLGYAGVALRNIVKRDASLMLAVSGASDFVIEHYSRALAGRLRAYADEYGRFTPYI